jgi:hypothetical protein
MTLHYAAYAWRYLTIAAQLAEPCLIENGALRDIASIGLARAVASLRHRPRHAAPAAVLVDLVSLLRRLALFLARIPGQYDSSNACHRREFL